MSDNDTKYDTRIAVIISCTHNQLNLERSLGMTALTLSLDNEAQFGPIVLKGHRTLCKFFNNHVEYPISMYLSWIGGVNLVPIHQQLAQQLCQIA